MDSALEKFCTTFAAGAGPGYVWCLDGGCLRAKMPPARPLPQSHTEDGFDYMRLCPLSAQATLEQGTVFYAWEYGEAARQLGVGFDILWYVTSASDNDYDPADVTLAQLRARLLRICGVEEE